MNAPLIPPITDADRLPDERAVWREGNGPVVDVPPHVQVSVDYGAGLIERTTMARASWKDVKRWRFGHPPQPAGNPFEGLGLAAKE